MSIQNILQPNNLNIYANDLQTSQIFATDITVSDQLLANNIVATNEVTCDTLIVEEIDGPNAIIELNKSLIPTQDNVINLGSAIRRINDIYAVNLSGALNIPVNLPTGIFFPGPNQQILENYATYNGTLTIIGYTNSSLEAGYTAYVIGSIVQLNFKFPPGTTINTPTILQIGENPDTLPDEITPTQDVMFAYPAQISPGNFAMCTGVINGQGIIELYGGVQLGKTFDASTIVGSISNTNFISVSYIGPAAA